MRGLAQKNALVTGAAKGIGRGIAERMEQECASGRFGYGINNEMKKICWCRRMLADFFYFIAVADFIGR